MRSTSLYHAAMDSSLENSRVPVGEGKVEPTALARAFYVQLEALARDEIGVDDDAFFCEAVVLVAPHFGVVGHDDPQVDVRLLPNLIVRV